MGLKEFAEGGDEGQGIVEFKVENGVAEGAIVQAGGREGIDGGGKGWRQHEVFVPPRHLAEAGGAETHGFGCRQQRHAAGAGGGEEPGKGLLAEGDNWLKHRVL